MYRTGSLVPDVLYVILAMASEAVSEITQVPVKEGHSVDTKDSKLDSKTHKHVFFKYQLGRLKCVHFFFHPFPYSS